jgi:transcription antitermination factor NusG
MPDWSLAITAVNSERLVADELRRRGHPCLWFKRRVQTARRGQLVERILPAFPRYVFIYSDQCWDVLHHVGRVVGLVVVGDEIGRVSGEVVDQLVDRCGGGDVLPPEAIPEPFSKGAKVIVGGFGPAAGLSGTYDALAESGKLRVMFDFMGRIVPIDIDARDVSGVLAESVKPKRKRKRRGRRRKVKEAVSVAPIQGSLEPRG